MQTNKGTSNQDLRTINSSIIMQYLKKNGVCSRAEISRAIGLTQASISKTISALIEYGIVKEVGYISGQKGRRSIAISFVEDNHKVIGVRLSRRSFSVGVFDVGGSLYEVCSEKIDEDQESHYTINRIKSAINAYLRRFNNVVAIGVAVPGPYLKTQGKIALITEMNNWLNIPLWDEFAGTYSIPIVIEHDANAGAFAEWWFGTQNKAEGRTLVYFLVGEGVGAGVLVNGNTLYGSQGIAGEIGHISVDVNGPKCRCGNHGCLELYCSSIAFVKHARGMLSTHADSALNKCYKLKAEDIFNAARSDDELSVQLVKRAGRYIGYGIVNIVNAYDPDIVVIGNSMSEGGQLLLEEAKAVVKEHILEELYENLDIVLSDFSTDPILYGASAVAIDFFLKHPSIFLGEKHKKSKRSTL